MQCDVTKDQGEEQHHWIMSQKKLREKFKSGPMVKTGNSCPWDDSSLTDASLIKQNNKVAHSQN